MKKAFVLSLAALIMLCICGCGSISKQMATNIDFTKDSVFLLSEKYLAELADDEVKIYSVDEKTQKTEEYAEIDGEYALADFSDGVLLLQNETSLISYDLETKQKSDLYSTVFTDKEKETTFKYQAFFANGTQNLIVTKIIYDMESPIVIASVQSGYNFSLDSGVYIYDILQNSITLKDVITVKDLSIELQGNEEISFIGADIGDGYISLSVQLNPATIPFYNELYYKIDASDSVVEKIGESDITESQSVYLQYSYLSNRLIKADEKRVVLVDFDSKKLYKFEFKGLTGVKGVDILETADKNYFFVNIGTQSGNSLFKFKIVDGVLNCEKGEEEMLSSVSLIQNGFARGNKLYFPEDADARKYGTLFVNGTTYRSYAKNAYLCDSDGKAVVIYE